MLKGDSKRKKPPSRTPSREAATGFYSVDRDARLSAPTITATDANPLGGATQDDLATVVANSLGVDPNLEAPEPAIAIDSLARVIAARMANSSSERDPKQLAVFILSDRPRAAAAALKAIREPTVNNGSRCLTGRLWIATSSFGSAYCLPFAATEPGEIFEEIEAKGCGGSPALVFDPTATEAEIRYYPNGLAEDNTVLRFLIAEEVFTLDGLDKVLVRFHEDNVITPDAGLAELDPWIDGRKYIPRERAEAFLQALLKTLLSIAFLKCHVDFERRGTEGRCDLLISSKQATVASGWLSHAALELKVLRSFSSSGKPVSSTVRKKAIADGLLQAIAYRKEQAAQIGMLCCYDMRRQSHCDGSACFNPIAAKAKRSGIELRHYRLYGTSADLRKDRHGD